MGYLMCSAGLPCALPVVRSLQHSASPNRCSIQKQNYCCCCIGGCRMRIGSKTAQVCGNASLVRHPVFSGALRGSGASTNIAGRGGSGRVGFGRQVCKLSRVGSRHPHPTRSVNNPVLFFALEPPGQTMTMAGGSCRKVSPGACTYHMRYRVLPCRLMHSHTPVGLPASMATLSGSISACSSRSLCPFGRAVRSS